MKKIIVSSDDLKPALKKLSHAFNAKSVLPALSNMLVKAEAGSVELITSDTENTISAKIKAETTGTFDLLIPFDFFCRVMALAGSTPVAIELNNNKGKILIEQDVYELKSLAKTEEFTKIPGLPKQNSLSLQPDFVQWLTEASKTVSGDEARPAMTCVCLDIKKEGLLVISTDAHTLFKHKIQGTAETEEQILIPHKLSKILAGMGELELSWNSKMIGVKAGNYTVWSRRQEYQFPDYNVIIPQTAENVELRHDSLSRALAKACLSSIEIKQTSFQFVSSNVLRLLTDDQNTERLIKVELPAAFAEDVPGFLINAEKLLTMLGQVKVENIKLHVASSTMAILLSSPEDPDYLGLIMPLAN